MVGPASHAKSSCCDRGQRTAEVLGALEERDLVAQLGQPGSGRHAAEAASDHHHTSHGGTLGVR